MRIHLIILFMTIACFSLFAETKATLFPVPQIPYWPKNYECRFTEKNITVDGLFDDEAWQQSYWTDSFVDIVSKDYPKPRFETKVKMLWNNDYLYLAADMEEPDLWATLTERDAVIFHDNDFEVFIDPDGDTHNYYELEINALNTVWDLFLLKPYRDGDKVAINSWDIKGLKTAVHLNGTLNDPRDKDKGWSIEIAIPWESLGELRDHIPPKEYETWRFNFSRVEWKHDVVNGQYVKSKDEKGNPLPEDNWVWSPQGLVAMHYPEMWGRVKFQKGVTFVTPNESILAERFIFEHLRLIYYAEKECYLRNHQYDPMIVREIKYNYPPEFLPSPPVIEDTSRSYIVHITSPNGKRTIYINDEGKTWVETSK
jgi:hypothetical protein